MISCRIYCEDKAGGGGGRPVQFIFVSPCSLVYIAFVITTQGGRDFAHFDLQISRRIFEEIRNDPIVIFRVLGEEIHEKT
jgi:hypothetical protein